MAIWSTIHLAKRSMAPIAGCPRGASVIRAKRKPHGFRSQPRHSCVFCALAPARKRERMAGGKLSVRKYYDDEVFAD